jgi:hypothetical protein
MSSGQHSCSRLQLCDFCLPYPGWKRGPQIRNERVSPRFTIVQTELQAHAFGGSDSSHVAKSVDGKLWFSPYEGISVIDPRHIPVNKLPPPVHIEQITADRRLRWQNLSGAAASNLHLPALSRDLVINYTALSFGAPEKVRFRIRLEGHDPDWKDAGNERKAFYNDLPPRHYRFRVMASNNSGAWNEAGDTLDFSIDPAYYQTTGSVRHASPRLSYCCEGCTGIVCIRSRGNSTRISKDASTSACASPAICTHLAQ